MLLHALLLCILAADNPDPAGKTAADLKKVIDVFVAASEQEADPVDPAVAFYQGAIPGMLRTLDPHSTFFDPDQFAQLKQMEKSEQKGFGSIVSVLPGRVIVLQALPGTPSAKAGLSPGDEILAINGYVLARLEFEQLVQLLGEARQKPASILVRRPGNAKLLEMTLTPEIMQSPSVDRSFTFDGDIGYLRATSFDDNTGKLIQETIEKLGGENRVAVPATGSAYFHGEGPHKENGRSAGRQRRCALQISRSGSDQRENRQRLRDRHRRATGSRSRDRAGRAQLWKRPGAERLSVVARYRRRAHRRVLLHAERPLHPASAAGRHA